MLSTPLSRLAAIASQLERDPVCENQEIPHHNQQQPAQQLTQQQQAAFVQQPGWYNMVQLTPNGQFNTAAAGQNQAFQMPVGLVPPGMMSNMTVPVSSCAPMNAFIPRASSFSPYQQRANCGPFTMFPAVQQMAAAAQPQTIALPPVQHEVPKNSTRKRRRRASWHSNKIEPENNKGKWTEEEDAFLRHLVHELGSTHSHAWTMIAEHMPHRNTKQCRERWCKHLDTTLKHGGWTEHEDKMILAARADGHGWAQISRMLDGRTDNTVKIRWNSLVRQRRRQAKRMAKEGNCDGIEAPASYCAAAGAAAGPPVKEEKGELKRQRIERAIARATAEPDATSGTDSTRPPLQQLKPISTAASSSEATVEVTTPPSVVTVATGASCTQAKKPQPQHPVWTTTATANGWTSLQMMPGKAPRPQQPRKPKTLHTQNNKGKWLKTEDRLLLELVAELGHNWPEVCLHIPGRNIKQCRERWCKHLDPRLRHGGWTAEEDAAILKLRAEKKGWAEIARSLVGRTDNKVKIRWNTLVRNNERAKRLKSLNERVRLMEEQAAAREAVTARAVAAATGAWRAEQQKKKQPEQQRDSSPAWVTESDEENPSM